jgi:nitrilase
VRHSVLNLGLAQMNSSPLRRENMKRVEEWSARAKGCDLLLFPEYVFCLGNGRALREAALEAAEWHAVLGSLAARRKMCIIFGGVPVLGAGKLRNACLAYGPDGDLLARYDKMHLFRMNDDQGSSIDETRVFEHGKAPVGVEIGGWNIALSVCYDLRFPELYRLLAPFDLLLAPSAFVENTGRAHWELLLRARAVENQCFAAAAAQCGKNGVTGTVCYGRSLIVDPWGGVLLDAGAEEEGVFSLRLERERIEAARRVLPALENRRIRLSRPPGADI